MGELPAREALRESEDLLQRGLRLDPNSAMLQNTVGMQRMFEWRWAEADGAYQRALELEPANPHIRMMYALFCSFREHHEEAVQ